MAGNLSRRREQDVLRLMMSNEFKVVSGGDSVEELVVEFPGPKHTAYEHGLWRVRVSLPSEYPYRSPSIGFVDPIFHPNIDLSSGSVCLDVINQTWSPMYSLLNVFEQFLPQLLTYPNASDPLNPVAAALLMRDSHAFEARARELAGMARPGAKQTQPQPQPQKKEERETTTTEQKNDLLGDFEL